MEMLTCTRCKVGKEGTSVFFPLHNKKKNGLDSWCRDCRAVYRSEICRGQFRDVISDVGLKELKAEITECVICGANEKLVIDHDHNTGKIRGLLCGHCNRGLGHFRDDPTLLEFAAQYLYASVDAPEWDKYKEKHMVE
jgi:hypothetical protein